MAQKIYSTPFILPLLPSRVDLSNLVAVFDADDTLWPQFNPAAKSVGVDPSKLDNFVVQNSPHYSKKEQEKLFEAFRNIQLFEQAEFYPGIEKMSLLYDLGVHIRIDSKSFTKEISEVKRRRFKTTMPFLQDSDLNLTISGQDHAASGKKIGKEATFFIDDNLYNIITSNATYNLLPCKTWNCSFNERYRMRSKNFYTLEGLDIILETLIRSVHFWQNTYSGL